MGGAAFLAWKGHLLRWRSSTMCTDIASSSRLALAVQAPCARPLRILGQAPSVSFVAVELMMTKFDLTLGAGGIMKGTITAQQGPPISASVEFKRTGEAKVALIPVSSAVSKELEGDWEGTLVVGPCASFPMTFHFKNQPDKTVLATMDSPARNAMAIPLNDVKQTGENVEFGIKVAHATFKGTLNHEGTELSGQFGHEQDIVQLTLKKK